MKIKKLIASSVIVSFLLILPSLLYAQDQDENAQKKTNSVKHSGIYIKFNISQSQGNIYGFDYKATSRGISLDKYFLKNRIGVPGWSIGYRKEEPSSIETGHLMSLSAFHTFGGDIQWFKVGAGVEWGIPSFAYYKTLNKYDENDDIVSSKHIFLYRNSEIPNKLLKLEGSGSKYMIIETSVYKRWKIIIVEAGSRFSFMKFGVDEYSFENKNYTFNLSDHRRVVPTLFISAGLKIHR